MFTKNGKFLFVTNPPLMCACGSDLVAFRASVARGSLTAVSRQNIAYNSLDDGLSHDKISTCTCFPDMILPTMGPHSAIDEFKTGDRRVDSDRNQ